MNPSEALRELCRRFLEQHPKEDRAGYLDEIANRITGMSVGMDAPYPKTVRELDNRVSGLLINAGKLDKVQNLLREMDKLDLSGETLESLAAQLEE